MNATTETGMNGREAVRLNSGILTPVCRHSSAWGVLNAHEQLRPQTEKSQCGVRRHRACRTRGGAPAEISPR